MSDDKDCSTNCKGENAIAESMTQGIRCFSNRKACKANSIKSYVGDHVGDIVHEAHGDRPQPFPYGSQDRGMRVREYDDQDNPRNDKV